MKRIAISIAALALLGSTMGCTPHMFRHAVGAAIVTAAIVGTAHAVAHHDDHFHHVNCGCPHEWEDGHWTYYYQDGWEYYDPQAGVWYRYR